MSEDKITTIMELKKRVRNPKTLELICHGGCIDEITDMVDEFEASVRKRLEELETRTIMEAGEDDVSDFEQTLLELRRILGEG